MTFGPLISPDWLAAHLGEHDLKIIDGSWRMPGQGHAIEQYRAAHIPGAVFFDVDAFSDQTSDLPHMLAPPAQFAAAIGALGVSERDRVVVYDDKGMFSAPRVWWTFRAMGHRDVAVLDGGLPAWLNAGGATTAQAPSPSVVSYRAAPQPQLCADADRVRAAIRDGGATIVDARSAERFAGAAPEPRQGLRSGHMPGAKNLAFTLLHGPDGRLLDPARLRAAFERAGVDLSRPVITSCGSGVTAAVLYLALEVLGHRDHAVYDGSWAEWGDERHEDARFPVIGSADGGNADSDIAGTA